MMTIEEAGKRTSEAFKRLRKRLNRLQKRKEAIVIKELKKLKKDNGSGDK